MTDEKDQDDKTEEPSERRLRQAVEKGDVPKSQEVNTLFVLGGVTLAIMLFATPAARDMTFSLRAFLANAHQVPSGGHGMQRAFETAFMAAAMAAGLPLLAMLLCAIAGGLVQHQPLWTTEPLAPKFSRLSPMQGLKRIFGKEAFVQFLKGLAKIALIGTVIAIVLTGEKDRVEALAKLEPIALLPAARDICLSLLTSALAIFAFVAAADFLYQRVTWHARQRMTKQEQKEEYKETEGSPEIKQKIASLRRQKAKNRMMAKVPKATVIIANPTHYAVALSYEPGMEAPICVAKGVDSLALRIRAVAEEAGVPVVENVPLARALHASAEIDDEIAVEHYKAVAEVIGYVLRLKKRRA